MSVFLQLRILVKSSRLRIEWQRILYDIMKLERECPFEKLEQPVSHRRKGNHKKNKRDRYNCEIPICKTYEEVFVYCE